MVVGSLLIASMLISGCNTTRPYYGEMTTASNYSQPNSIVDVVANMTKANAYSVPRRDRDQHEQCIFFALDNMQLGERCDWYSNSSSANGTVQVVSHRPAGSGYCTTLFNTVFYKGKSNSWQDTACKRGAGNQWRFVSR